MHGRGHVTVLLQGLVKEREKSSHTQVSTLHNSTCHNYQVIVNRAIYKVNNIPLYYSSQNEAVQINLHNLR